MRIYVVMAALLATGTAQAWEWSDDCAYERQVDTVLGLDGSELLSVVAGAGDLRITGHADGNEARVSGRVCVSEEEWLEETGVVAEGGREASIAVMLPDRSGWNLMGSNYAYVDLKIEVPAGIALDVHDSSGDIDIRGTGPVTVKDSSGEIELDSIHGAVVLEDSSGDIELTDIGGDVTVRRDSSGDIEGRGIRGSVRVEKDSSGEIRFRDVRDDFVVERDSSGDIVADTIGGDFRVEHDGSGEIRSSGVKGSVKLPGS